MGIVYNISHKLTIWYKEWLDVVNYQDGHIIPIATINAKNTAINFRFFIDVANESLAVMNDKCNVVGFGSLPKADADNQCLARCRSSPIVMIKHH
jgi:hypothetical protein